MRPRLRLLSLITAFALLPPLAACGAIDALYPPRDEASGGGVSPERCAQLLSEPPQTEQPSNVTLLLADASASTVSAKGDQRQDWAGLLAGQVPPEPRMFVRAAVFGGDVRWAAGKVTPGASSNEHRRRHAARDLPLCLRDELNEHLRTAPGRPGSDVLRAISEAADELQGVPGVKRIVVATDGLSNTGCADLRAADIGDHSAIPEIVQECAEDTKELPRISNTVEIVLVGLGKPAEGHPDLLTPHRTWLVELWWELCKKTGARCPRPSAKAPERTEYRAARKPPEDAPVEMPEIKREGRNPIVFSVPAVVLFDSDQHELAPRAQDAIADILRELREIDYTRIEVRGHTDARHTAAYNQELSEKRAAAVAAELRAKGVTRLTAKGFGEREPRCTPQYRNGVPDRVNMACNRRVEVVAYTRS